MQVQARSNCSFAIFLDISGTADMIWDFEDIFFAAVISCYLVLVLGLILRRSSLRWGNRKVAAFYLSVHCFAFFLIFLFWSATSLLPCAEIQGQVSQVNLRYPFPLERHRQFQVTSPNGLRVKVVSEHHLAELLRIGEIVYVRYDPVTSEPESVARLDGPNRQLLFDSQNYPIFRILRLSDYPVLLAIAIAGIYGVRKFQRGDP
jgi:hypothetical protein